VLVFYFFAAIVLWLGFLSLRNGFSFSAYVRRELARPQAYFAPFASVIAPCRGLDHGLRENIAALFQQHYPAYEVIFVTDRAEDPSLGVIEEVIGFEVKGQRISSRVVIAGDAIDSEGA
jgi:hypothetical protein